MSGSQAATVEELAVGVLCPTCQASAGQPCRTSTGNLANPTHERRVGPFRDAYAAGYSQGWRDMRERTEVILREKLTRATR